MDVYDQFLARLEIAIKKAGNLRRLSELSGISYATLYHWRAKECAPSLDNIRPLLPYLENFRLEPIESEKQIIKDTTSNPVIKVLDESNSVTVPVMGEVGAGNPVDPWNVEPIDSISIMPEYVKPNMKVFKVTGDSMQPTIKKGAYVGVTPVQDFFLKEGQIYLCYQPPFGMVVKRVRPAPHNTVMLLSDNPEYEPIPVSLDEYSKVVLGEVRWVLQSV